MNSMSTERIDKHSEYLKRMERSIKDEAKQRNKIKRPFGS